MSQNAMILDYMERNGSITQAEAINQFGCYRLGARIFDLRAVGFDIVRRMEEGTNRFGSRIRYARYFLGGKDGKEGLPVHDVQMSI